MDRLITVLSEATAEYTEKKSRFIATVRHCESEIEAMAFIEEMRKKYWDARHNVYAFSVNGGSLCRFSDDGEPHGTAGKPMLDVIAGSGVTDIAAVVTRYFGGVLLGTGGLVRAYTKALSDALQTADIYEMVPATVFETECDYTLHSKLVSVIESFGGIVKDTVFADKVTVVYSLNDGFIGEYSEKLRESFSGRLKADEKKKEILPQILKK